MELAEKIFRGSPEISSERALKSHFIEILMEPLSVGVLAGLVDKEGNKPGAKVIGDPGPWAIRNVTDIFPVPEIFQ